MSVLVAEHLVQSYEVANGFLRGKSVLKAVSDVSLSIEAGKTLAVVGESGCGKSTLARMITMIEAPKSGRITISGTEVTPEARRALRDKVQIVFQDPYGSLNLRHRVSFILEEPLIINRPEMSAAERRAKVDEMLSLVGLRVEYRDRYPHMFSGGQRQRIAIARALMLDPALLVLDEPVSALDLSIQSQILNLLIELQERLGIAYLFISHDLSVVKHVADEVMVMYLGRVVERGSRDAVFASPAHPYTRALLSATPSTDPERSRNRIKLKGELPTPLNIPPGCPFAPRCWKATDLCRQTRPELSPAPDGQQHQMACHFPETGAL